MKTFKYMSGFGFIALCLYLLLWPVSVSPQAWSAPENPGFTGDFSPNNELADLKFLSIGARHGPEDVAAHMTEDGLRLYVSSQDGDIIEINPQTNSHRVFAKTGGVPLGIEFDAKGHLIVADAHLGLLLVEPSGVVTVLSDRVNDTPILYADDVDIGPDGLIYFTDASTKFGAKAAGSTMAGSVQEIFEHARTGRILAYDPSVDETFEIAAGLSFPNGIAVAPDGSSLLFIETGEYRLMRLFLRGERLRDIETVYDNFPGFPDNINPGPPLADGTPSYFIGLVSPRNNLMDKLSNRPFLRQIIWRFPDFMKPKATLYSHLVQIDEGGRIIKSWQDPSGAYPLVTGAIMAEDRLYLSSLGASALGYRDF